MVQGFHLSTLETKAGGSLSWKTARTTKRNPEHASAHGEEEKLSSLGAVVTGGWSHHCWGLEIELQSSGRTRCAGNLSYHAIPTDALLTVILQIIITVLIIAVVVVLCCSFR